MKDRWTIVNSRFLTQSITGVQRSAIDTARRLREASPEIGFIAPRSIVHVDQARELQAFVCGRYSGHLWEQYELVKFLYRNNRPLLLNLANTAPLNYRKQITTIHDVAFFKNPEWFSRKFRYFYNFLIPRIARKSLKIITPSEFSKREIAKFLEIPNEKIEVIYNTVSKELRTMARRDYPNKYGKYILTVASLEPRKNLGNLIEAFKSLKLKNYKLLFAGTGSKIFSDYGLKKSMVNEEDLIFTGRVSDEELVGLYKNARLFVYVSLYEGFGLPPLESMACGCPVVVSNSTSLPEVCGDAAYYVDPANIYNIAEGISKLLEDDSLRKELRKKGFKRVDFFSGDVSIRNLVRILGEVAGNG